MFTFEKTNRKSPTELDQWINYWHLFKMFYY